MFYFRVFLLLAVTISMYKFYGLSAGLLGLAISIGKILYTLGYMKSIKIFKTSFSKGIVFTKDYTGSYKNIYIAFKEAETLIHKFRLGNDYKIIGLYYDNDKTPDDKKRACVGLYKKLVSQDDKVDLNLEDFGKDINNGFKISNFEATPALYATWDFVNTFSMMIGIKKFYAELHDSLKNKYFRKNYKIESEEVKVCIELYESDTSLKFYVPLTQQESFLIHDDFKKKE